MEAVGRTLVWRRLQQNIVIAPDTDKTVPEQFSLLEPSEDMTTFEYRVLFTSLTSEVLTDLSIIGIVLIAKTILMKLKVNGAGVAL